jgi:hypothetical protein
MNGDPQATRIGRRYRANRLAGSCDAVVIGSGIACQLEWAPMEADYDRFYVGDRVYTVLPRTAVRNTRVSPICSAGMSNRLRSL